MAGRTILRRWFIEQNGLFGNHFRQLVTIAAADILVSSLQGKGRFLVIECGGLPLHAVVTLGATGHVRFGELLPMDILMALFALQGRCSEVHVDELGLKVWRFVTVAASRGLMRAD